MKIALNRDLAGAIAGLLNWGEHTATTPSGLPELDELVGVGAAVPVTQAGIDVDNRLRVTFGNFMSTIFDGHPSCNSRTRTITLRSADCRVTVELNLA